MSTENKPLVSICCLVYNHEPYLRDCFEGFIKQKTSFPIEILIHDDASTDRSADIIREYTAKYPDLFKPIYQTENQYSKGVKISFEYQYPRAQGKYIALCEGDDYWVDPNKLQMQVDWLESHPDYTMCFHRSKIIKESEAHCSLKCDSIENRDYSATELFQEWIVPTASICIRKEVLAYPIKHPEKILNGDIILVEKAAHTGKVRGFKDTMAVYRVHANGITYDSTQKKERLKKYPGHYKCIKENFPLIDRNITKKTIYNSYIWLWGADKYHLKWQIKAFFTYPTYFFKDQFTQNTATSLQLIRQKHYKEAIISLPILKILILFIYYNILKKNRIPAQGLK